jgi:hypothetical protein
MREIRIEGECRRCRGIPPGVAKARHQDCFHHATWLPARMSGPLRGSFHAADFQAGKQGMSSLAAPRRRKRAALRRGKGGCRWLGVHGEGIGVQKGFYPKPCAISGKVINYEDKTSPWKITGFFSQKQHLCQREHARRYPEGTMSPGGRGGRLLQSLALLTSYASSRNDETRIIVSL